MVSLRSAQLKEKRCSLSNQWKDDINDALKKHLWPHVKYFNNDESEEESMKILCRVTNWSLDEFESKRSLVLSWLKRNLRIMRSNMKRKVLASHTSKFWKVYFCIKYQCQLCDVCGLTVWFNRTNEISQESWEAYASYN
jgi:hypothetical protein